MATLPKIQNSTHLPPSNFYQKACYTTLGGAIEKHPSTIFFLLRSRVRGLHPQQNALDRQGLLKLFISFWSKIVEYIYCLKFKAKLYTEKWLPSNTVALKTFIENYLTSHRIDILRFHVTYIIVSPFYMKYFPLCSKRTIGSLRSIWSSSAAEYNIYSSNSFRRNFFEWKSIIVYLKRNTHSKWNFLFYDKMKSVFCSGTYVLLH